MAPRSAPLPAPQILEEIAFQKATVSRLRHEIGDVDRNSRRRYIREFHEDFESFEAPSSWDDLVMACFRADIIYIGDYHALPSAQEFASRLLSEVAERSARVVLGMEMVFGRHQRTLDQYLHGRLDDGAFLRAIRYEQDWGYDWQSFKRLFDVARSHAITVAGLDCAPRTGFRNIRRRDRYAGERIADLVEDYPGARTVVLFGESHLAREHLPRQVSQRLKKRGLERRALIVLQNLEAIYWGLIQKGWDGVEVARLADDAYCHFNAGPIAKYEAYRRTIEMWKGDPDQEGVDLTSTVHGIIDIVLRFLKIDPYVHHVRGPGRGRDLLIDIYPDVHSNLDRSDLLEMLRRARFNEDEQAEILDHVTRNGSCYVPRLNAIFLGQFNLVHAGEEAAHFVNQTLKGEVYEWAPRTLPQHDVFYTAVIEEALGFFGSKIVDPSRNHFFETEFYQYYRKERALIEAHTPYTFEEFNQIIEFILLHKKFEQTYEQYGDVPQEILDGVKSEPKRANVLAHELGYFLGQQLYDAYRAGLIERKDIVKLFKTSFLETGSALETYLDLTKRVAPVMNGGLTPAGGAS
jgi:hypothetical protein